MGYTPGAIVHRPTAWSRKGKSPQTRTIRGSKWKQQEAAWLLQGIFSFVFIFILKTESQWEARRQLRTSERGPGHEDTELRPDSHLFTATTRMDPEGAKPCHQSTLSHSPWGNSLGEGKGGGSHGTAFTDTPGWLSCSSHIKKPRLASQNRLSEELPLKAF